MNGNSAMSFGNGEAMCLKGAGRDLPYWFRMAMPVPVTLLMGAS
jgi:hypothetical protein